MVRNNLKILQHLLQDFQSLSDHFGRLCIKGLILNHVVVVDLFPLTSYLDLLFRYTNENLKCVIYINKRICKQVGHNLNNKGSAHVQSEGVLEVCNGDDLRQ